MQKILINNLKINTIIGVLGYERAIKQPLLIDVSMDCDMSKACVSDDIADAVNYASICEDIERVCQQSQAQLLEHLAYKISEFLFHHYPCHAINLTLKKPIAIINADNVGISMGFTRQEFVDF